MIRLSVFAVIAAAALIGADWAAGTYYALPYAAVCVGAVFWADRWMESR